MDHTSPFSDPPGTSNPAALYAYHAHVLQNNGKPLREMFLRRTTKEKLRRADEIQRANVTVIEQAGDTIPKQDLHLFRSELVVAGILRKNIQKDLERGIKVDSCSEDVKDYKSQAKATGLKIQGSSDSRRLLGICQGSSSLSLHEKVEEYMQENPWISTNPAPSNREAAAGAQDTSKDSPAEHTPQEGGEGSPRS